MNAQADPERDGHDEELAAGAVRLRIDLAYEGTAFHGWQIQPGLRTVQGELGEMLARLLRRPVPTVGAGRTDAGVHARGQVCSLTVRGDAEAQRLCKRLAALAPGDLQILDVRPVGPKFNARFGAAARRYSYHLLRRPDVFLTRTAFLIHGRLDPSAMDAAAAHFVGTHDFTSFCKVSSLREGSANVCTVDACRFAWSPGSAILHVRADHFLHNMVRVMTGTLVEVGLGRRQPDDIPVILAARDRQRAGRTMPARGVCLEEVIYPDELSDPPRGGTGAAGEPPGAGAREEGT